MEVGEQRVDDAKRVARLDQEARLPARGTRTCAGPLRIGGALERAHHGRADRDDRRAARARFGNLRGERRRRRRSARRAWVSSRSSDRHGPEGAEPDVERRATRRSTPRASSASSSAARQVQAAVGAATEPCAARTPSGSARASAGSSSRRRYGGSGTWPCSLEPASSTPPGALTRDVEHAVLARARSTSAASSPRRRRRVPGAQRLVGAPERRASARGSPAPAGRARRSEQELDRAAAVSRRRPKTRARRTRVSFSTTSAPSGNELRPVADRRGARSPPPSSTSRRAPSRSAGGRCAMSASGSS